MKTTITMKKILASKQFIIALICVTVVLVSAIVAVFSVSLAIKAKTSEDIVSLEKSDGIEDVDHIIILGAGLRSDGSPSDMLADRLKTGVALLELHPKAKLLLTGDNSGEHYNEVAAMKKFVVELGVSEEKLVEDGKGYSTYESLYRAVNTYGVKNAIIVTQEYHLHRALYIADRMNVDAVGVSADLRSYSGQSIRNAREHLARVKDFFLTLINDADSTEV